MKVNPGYYLLMAELITKVYIASRTRRNKPSQFHSVVNHFTDNPHPLFFENKNSILHYFSIS